jgi:hypothetical protein
VGKILKAKSFFVVFTQIFAISLFSPMNSASAEVPELKARYLLSCYSTPNDACIEQIVAITSENERIVAERPVRSVEVLSDVNATDIREEYAFPGLTFEGSAGNRAVPGVIFSPYGGKNCRLKVCYQGLEELQVGMQASWMNQSKAEEEIYLVDTTRRGSQFLCGPATKPERCRRNLNFNTEVGFEFTIRVPEDFVASAVLGSVKNLTFEQGLKTISTVEKKLTTLKVSFKTQVLQRPLFSELIPNPMGTSEYADFIADASNLWIIGRRNNLIAPLGTCSTIPFITVLSNSTFQGMPTWNPTTSSIEVGLTAPHFTVNGQLHRGYFEATISKEMGLCLWGIDLSKQAVATMSISYPSGGGTEVQTVSGKFDGKNYILFSANFHYSSPTVAFKLTQDSKQVQEVAPVEEAKPVQESKPVAVAAVPIKKTISCVKGKTTKRVTAEKPKCPKGFKLKV